jgi:predicted dehydrogenase
MDRKIRMGMVGGGKDAFIGQIHRMAASLTEKIELVCGAFSSTPEKSKASGKDFFLPPEKTYGTYEEMFAKEKALAVGERMDFVTIVTPNHVHFPVAKAALENGFPVVCDKPMTFNLAEAKELEALVGKTGLPFALTHNYTGYPMVKQARELVLSGKLGKVRKIVVQYPQDWLSTLKEAEDNKQAEWRTDPARSGASGCIGDIGTHAENLAEYITDLEIDEVCADFTTFVKGRKLEDDGNILIHYKGGARGVLIASQISPGEENALRIRVYCEKGALWWRQQEPNTLTVKWLDEPGQVYRTGLDYNTERATEGKWLPSGHVEGYLEAFAIIYKNFAQSLAARLSGEKASALSLDFPGVKEGVRGMAFIESVVESASSDKKWTKMRT